jgi:hypothetical protein
MLLAGGAVWAEEWLAAPRRWWVKAAFLGLFDTYNYSEMRPPQTLWEKVSYVGQKIHFHPQYVSCDP